MTRSGLIIVAACLGAAWATTGAANAAATARPGPGNITGAAVVLDGDTLTVAGRKVRLHGVDAFEAEQTCADRRGVSYGCGGHATRYLARLANGRLVSCGGRDVDRYGRLVAVCRVGGVDLGEALVRAGHALAFRRYALDYVDEERAARGAKAGAWAGRFTEPADFRAAAQGAIVARAQRQADAPTGGCVIKGNVNRRGEHLPHAVRSLLRPDQGRGRVLLGTAGRAGRLPPRRAAPRLMPLGSVHDEVGMLLSGPHGPLLRRDDGGEWRLDGPAALTRSGGRRVRVRGRRVGFDLLRVESLDGKALAEPRRELFVVASVLILVMVLVRSVA